MNRYFVTTTDPDGRQDVRHVEAVSAAAALAELEADGHRDLTLHTDDVSAEAVRGQPDAPDLTPKEQLELRAVGPLGFAWALAKLFYRKTWLSHLIAAGVVIFVVQRDGWGFYAWLAAAWLVFPLPFSLYSSFVGPHRRYNRLLTAASWGRWEKVLALAPGLRGKVPDLELDAREAVALAGLGRLEEGLELMAPHLGPPPGVGRHPDADDEDAAAWSAEEVADLFPDEEPPAEPASPQTAALAMAHGRTAEAYGVAERYDDVLERLRRAHDLAPDDPTIGLDLALELLKRGEATAEARRLLDAAAAGPVSDLLAAIMPFAEGLWALRTGDARGADARLSEALDRTAPFAPGNPLMALMRDMMRAWRALARADHGDLPGARRDARSARPRLTALRSRRLLTELDAAVPPE
ncbi:hypothetical protein [Alienimonas californiensis]|uniref:Tetratricopeptide repeat protein n=1 Tax=Alienimonas californiensis TaxID=2527989 RepID=A0A517P4P9_9PLAN|nr:hypothetical protein [Alienimonas californiensis]QDT14350.1 hypothetical protein CA12_04230 [Alienimonas californiensis]